MLLSEMQGKDIINLNTGNNLGRIVDVEVGSDGRVINIVAEQRKFFFRLFKSEETTFKYEDITKIGTDVILIKM